MDYDVLVLGGGIIGCALAYELSRYNLNIAVIEKSYDIGTDTALMNNATVYDGLECDDELSSKLIRKGRIILEEYTKKFNVPYKKCGSVYIAKNSIQKKLLLKMYEKAQSKNVHGVKLLYGDEIFDLEPNLSRDVIMALYIPNTGVIRSYNLILAYAEIAFDNGVKFKFEEEVLNLQKMSKGYRVETNRNKFTCKIVIDTTLDEKLLQCKDADIESYKKNYLKYIIINKPYVDLYSNIIFDITGRERIYLRPTMKGTMLAAYGNEDNITYDNVISRIKPLTKNFSNKQIKMVLDWHSSNKPVKINNRLKEDGYINIDVRHFGHVTMAPAIAVSVCNMVVEVLNCKLNKDFIDKPREYYKFSELSNKERNSIIKIDPKYGKIVCPCENVTEGEIIDSIRRPLGARTLEGIKRRTGAGIGECRGCYCVDEVVAILARETNKRVTEIVKHSKNSKIALGRIKEFNEM